MLNTPFSRHESELQLKSFSILHSHEYLHNNKNVLNIFGNIDYIKVTFQDRKTVNKMNYA